MSEPSSLLPRHLQRVTTPALLVIASRFHANLNKMAQHCEQHDILLRPHAKTHKAATVAKAQIEQGAVGICCATLSEAELLGDHIDDILITSPLTLPEQVQRLQSLQHRNRKITCVIDDPSTVKLYEDTLTRDQPLNVLLDLDPGMHRTGISMDQIAVDFARKLDESDVLTFKGIQCYAGNLMHVSSLEERAQRVGEIWERVGTFKERLLSEGLPCETVTGGGTGSFDLDWPAGVSTELQAGSYPFMDLEYNSIEWGHQSEPPFQQSLFVLTTIVSANTPGQATTDAGLKAFSTDSVLPEVYAGLQQPAKYIFKGDEHGGIVFDDSSSQANVGEQLLVSPPHCDPTINLYDHFLFVDDDLQVLESIAIDARSGRRYQHV